MAGLYFGTALSSYISFQRCRFGCRTKSANHSLEKALADGNQDTFAFSSKSNRTVLSRAEAALVRRSGERCIAGLNAGRSGPRPAMQNTAGWFHPGRRAGPGVPLFSGAICENGAGGGT